MGKAVERTGQFTPVSYNIEPGEIGDDYASLFETRRRDALFALATPHKDGMLLLRDHMGNVPLYYRKSTKGLRASLHLTELLEGDETVSDIGLRTFLGVGSAKISPLFNEIRLAPAGTALLIRPDGAEEILYEYRFEPRTLPSWSFTDCVMEADRLLLQAARRVQKNERIGLYLSGGIDSALSGIYLKKAGAQIHAYTATPWGQESEEARLAKLNGEAIGVASHALVPLDTNKYGAYLDASLSRYGNLCGTASQMAILALLLQTEVGNEKQVAFAQNCDTMNTSVPDQSLLSFLAPLPGMLRGALHSALGARSIMDELISFRTSGLVRHYAPFMPYERALNPLQKLALAGMRFAHSPVDGDIVVLPSIQNQQVASNLFYDVDVIEFALGIPLLFRLAWSKESKIGIALNKRVFKALARKYLPGEIVDRKKGLTVPVKRDDRSQAFFDSLPTSVGNLTLTLPSQRLAGDMLRRLSETSPTPASLKELFTA